MIDEKQVKRFKPSEYDRFYAEGAEPRENTNESNCFNR